MCLINEHFLHIPLHFEMTLKPLARDGFWGFEMSLIKIIGPYAFFFFYFSQCTMRDLLFCKHSNWSQDSLRTGKCKICRSCFWFLYIQKWEEEEYILTKIKQLRQICCYSLYRNIIPVTDFNSSKNSIEGINDHFIKNQQYQVFMERWRNPNYHKSLVGKNYENW